MTSARCPPIQFLLHSKHLKSFSWGSCIALKPFHSWEWPKMNFSLQYKWNLSRKVMKSKTNFSRQWELKVKSWWWECLIILRLTKVLRLKHQSCFNLKPNTNLLQLKMLLSDPSTHLRKRIPGIYWHTLKFTCLSLHCVKTLWAYNLFAPSAF